MALLAVFDEQETGVSISRCSRVLWIAALSTRFAEPHSSLGICDEVETIFTLVPDELIIERTKNCYAGRGGHGTRFLYMDRSKNKNFSGLAKTFSSL